MWYGTSYKADFETNNGLGIEDVNVSKSQNNQCTVELELASNFQLAHVFERFDIYKKFNNTDGIVIAIF